MINALFYSFAKKVNSTALPGTGVTVQVELKEETDILSPVLLISPATGITTPYQWNYCYLSSFSRYYYVEDWTWKNGIWECILKVDVLASYKAAIGASSQYVLRSASSSDGTIVDTLYPIKSSIHLDGLPFSVSRPLASTLGQGYYVVGVIGNHASAGCVNYYILSNSQFTALKTALFQNLTWTSVSDVSENLLKTLFNPYDYIVSCKWFPVTNIKSHFFTTDSSEINIGYWTLSVPCTRILDTSAMYSKWKWSIDKTRFGSHPQVSRGSFLQRAPYAKYLMNLAPYGSIDLPDSVYVFGVTCVEIIDYITGECILKIFAGIGGDETTVPLLTLRSEMGVDMQLAQVSSTGGIKGIGQNLAVSAGQKILSQLPDSPITSVLSGIANASLQDNHTVVTSGSNGGFAKLNEFNDYQCECSAIYSYIADEDNVHFGRPLCKPKTISTLSGYILCSNAEVPISGSSAEQAEVNRYLNTGFFYE